MAMIPGQIRFAGGAAYGALQGALLTPGFEGRGHCRGLGAAGGALEPGWRRLLARLLRSRQTRMRRCWRRGNPTDPGAECGGWLKALEDKATSIPFVGDIIQAQERRG